MNPSIAVLGAFFPSWMLCGLVGIVLAIVGHRALVALGIEPWIGPRAIVYPALAIAFCLATWIALFRN